MGLSVAVQIFSFSAVVTSFVGFYYGMRGYVKDVLVESSASGLADDERILAATDPGLFLPALEVFTGLIPFLGQMNSLIGAVFDPLLCFVLPSIMLYKSGLPMAPIDKAG